ncbi:MAG: DUF494 family protein [Candidatus Kapaibacterium sp.]
MAERIMEIIIRVISDLESSQDISDTNIKDLESLGYTASEISTAFSWLADRTEKVMLSESNPFFSKTRGFRILLEEEKELFTYEAYKELIQYISFKLISNEQLEMLLDRAMFSNLPLIDVRLLRHFIVALNFDNSLTSKYAGRMMLDGNDTIN